MAVLLATSPYLSFGEGMQARRLVLKVDAYGTRNQEYIIHNEFVDETGKVSYGDGDYRRNWNEAWDVFITRQTAMMAKIDNPDTGVTLYNLDAPRMKNVVVIVPGKGGI